MRGHGFRTIQKNRRPWETIFSSGKRGSGALGPGGVQGRSPAGMTLVEILIALSIFSILTIILINFWRHGIVSSQTGMTQADNLQKTRLLLAQFEKDIREATEVLHYEDTGDATVVHLKRSVGPFDKPEDEFLVYTYYKTQTTLGGVQVTCALCKDTYKDAPEKGKRAEKVLIKGIEKSLTANSVGILPEAVDQNNRVWKSHIYAYNIFVDPAYLDKDFLSDTDKDAKLALARFKNADSASGFDDIQKIVAFEIKFFTNDDRNNVKVFHTIAYVRARYYQQIYEQ